MKRAHYTTKLIFDDVILKDLNGPISISNFAEEIISELLNNFNVIGRVIYLDSESEWSELLHDGSKFIGFKHIEPNDTIRHLFQLV